MKKANIM